MIARLNKWKYFLYTFSVSLFPLLFFYNINKQEIGISAILVPLAVLVFFTLTLFFIMRLAMRDNFKAAFATCIVSLVFFSYGHIALFFRSYKIFKNSLYSYYFLYVLVLAVFFLLIYIIRSKRSFFPASRFFGIIFGVLNILIIFQIGFFEAGRLKMNIAEYISDKKAIDQKQNDNTCSTGKCRDIYYIIVEKYAGNGVLKDYFGYDNSDFTSYLKTKGFALAEEARSNYLVTPLSLASSLNMDYLTALEKRPGPKSGDRTPLFKMLNDYKVWRYLKSKGYKFIHIGSYWDINQYNKNADKNFVYKMFGLSDFSRTFLDTTMLHPFINSMNVKNPLSLTRIHYDFSLKQLDKVSEFSREKGPKFVFVHLYVTHGPYVFDREGKYLDQKEYENRGYKKMYIETLMYANTRLKEIVENILITSMPEPVIVLQGDEGPRSERFMDFTATPWKRSTNEEYEIKTSILNALYLPGTDKNLVYSRMTPVNTFRLIFNQYFGEKYPLLPDRIYAHPDYMHPYQFSNISNKVY